MFKNFYYITHLQYQVKSLNHRVAVFESGEKYVTMQLEFKNQLSKKDREIRYLKLELAKNRRQTVTIRNNWFQVSEDMEQEHAKELQQKDRRIVALKKRVLEVEILLDLEKDKHRVTMEELDQVKSELEEERGKNHKLRAQINRDYENSSTPSSLKPNHKKISNNREKTGKKPGGQPGHKGHGRKKHCPTNSIDIPPPEKYTNNPSYKPTGKIITKQVVNLNIRVTVDEYSTPEFRNVHTGQRVHADFPNGVINEVNYGGSVKALSFLLNNRYNVAIDKVREVLSELTNGELEVSKGMISGLSKEFSIKTEAQQKKAFSDLLLSPVMNADFTNARLNGKNVQVALCANEDIALYFAREQKGHKGLKGTPVEDYQGVLVHDHDTTFYSYGNDHQECLAHILRYLKDSMVNEPGLKWNQQMRALIQEMIHYRNGLLPKASLESNYAKEYEESYQRILEVAKHEYEDNPPSAYYREGFNLYKRLVKYKDYHLLFLYNEKVPTNNNLAERLLRNFKRKQRQVMTFRSFDSLAYLCNSIGMIALLRSNGKNLYSSIASIFE